MFVTPVFKTIKQAYPEASIDALIAANVHQICLYNKNITNIIAFDKTNRQAGVIEHLKLVKKIRKSRYDLVINLNPSERASLIAAFSGGKKVCGFASKTLRFFFNPFLIKDRSIHSTDSYLKALEEIGIPRHQDNRLEMNYDQQSEATTERIWIDNNLQDQVVVGIHPGANWLSKRWKPDKLSQLSNMLHQDGIKTVFFGGKDDLETMEKVVAQCKTKPVVLTGKLNLLELAATIKKCSVFVSADSGPMHIAVSQQVPVVALFGPTSPKRYGPYNSPHIVIQPDNNILNNLDESELKKKCMDYISTDRVYQAVLSLLNTKD